VDALSHALIALILFSATGLTLLLPFAILGAVIMDADIFFSFISDSDPLLYLFTHGGIAHSLAGALVLSVLAYVATVLIALAGIVPLAALGGYGVYGFAAILGGTLSTLRLTPWPARASRCLPRLLTGNIPWVSCPVPVSCSPPQLWDLSR